MMRRQACVAVLVWVAALAACENKSSGTTGGMPLPSRAAVVGELADNPLIGFVPADAPYVFASFKPFPLEVIHKLGAMIGPIWRSSFAAYTSSRAGSDDELQRSKDVLEMLDTLDVKKFEDYGFSAKARFVVYGGLGAYPVFRVELSSGDRLFDLVKSTATRWNEQLPPPTERAGRRYWIVDAPNDHAMFVAIAPKELVFAFATRALVEANLPVLIGDERPATSMTTAQFRTLAERDGFTGQGLGFVDLVRVGTLITSAVGAAPECGVAVTAISKRVPRLAFGYDDFTVHKFAFGMVLELAPDVLAEARGLTGSLAGLDRLLAQKPAMVMAVAGNIEHGRTALGRIAGALQELGQRCQLEGVVKGASGLAAVAGRPLPPIVAGLRGGFAVLTNLKIGPNGPETVEGYGAVQLDHTGDLLKLASSQVPNLSVQADGKAHPLPPSVIPFPGHVAASETAIGVGLGPNSASTAVGALQGKAVPAPLAMMAFDYSRMGDLVLASQHGVDADNLREMIKSFGMLTMQILVDARGLVTWTSFELR